MKSKENPKSRNQDSPLCKLKPPPDPCARALPPENYPPLYPLQKFTPPPPSRGANLNLERKNGKMTQILLCKLYRKCVQ